MKTILKKNTFDIGVKLGIILFLITITIYVIDINYFSNLFLMLGVYRFPVIAFGIYAIVNNKKLNNGFLSFKEAFTSYFLCIVLGYLIVNLGSIFIFKFYDPVSAETINQNMAPAVRDFMNTFNSFIYIFPPEMVEVETERIRNFDGFSYPNIIEQFFYRLLMNAIFAVPVALILKKQN